ncbi:MAG: glycosyltransferase [Bacteroidota bacterium]|nr:glycosyltransferase [Bacteroidota bacterium]
MMKLLLLSLDSYSIFHTDTKFIFGGAEIETGYHAKGLAARGINVSVVTRDHAVPKHEIEKVTLLPHPGMKGTGYWNKRKSLGGRISFRLFGDNNPFKTVDELYSDINPDAAYVMGMSHEALHLARFCKTYNKEFIFRVAHDLDLVGDEFDEEKIKKWAGISFNEVKEIIEGATIVLTQTQTQDKLLKKWFGRDGVLMFPPIDITLKEKPQEKKYDIFWVGKNNVFKRPEKIIELARRLPQRKFCMVLNKMDEISWNRIVAEIPVNVHLEESVPADKIEKYFSSSKLFVSTSLHEGFANTFLQAGKNSVPVISMGSDPNNMLSEHNAGVLVGDDMNKLEAAVEELLNNENSYKALCKSARAYVEKFHDREKINKQFYDLLIPVPANG